MTEKKEKSKEFSTCLEGTPFARMMQKMMGHGKGPLRGEMLKKFTRQGDAGGFCCAMLQTFMNGCGGVQREDREPQKEEGHDQQ